MGIVEIRPNATVSNTFTVVGGSGTAHGVTSDNLDTSYLEGTIDFFREALLDMATYVIPAGKYIKQARIKVRYLIRQTGYFAPLWYVRFANPAGQAGTQDPRNDNPTVATTNTGPWRTTAPDGQSWGQAQIDAIRVNFYTGYYDDDYKQPRVFEFYVELDEYSSPTAAVSAPTGTVTTTTRPNVIFTYSDVDGDQMDAYRIKVFTAAQYGAGGFDFWSSVGVWDSGKVSATSPNPAGYQIPVDLLNGTTYRAYVVVFQAGTANAAGNGVSAPANSQFTISITPPALPTISSVAADPPNSRITFNYKSNDTLAQTIDIERSFNAGVTWTPVRGATDIPVTQTNAAMSDYEAVPNKGITYRARTRYIVTGSIITSAWTTATSPVTLVDNEWRLKLPGDSTQSIILNVIGDDVTENIPEDKATFNPLGRTYKITVADVVKGTESVLKLDFLTDAAYRAFETLRNLQKTLLLVRGWTGEQWYISFGEVLSVKLFNYSPNLYRIIDITWVEVGSDL